MKRKIVALFAHPDDESFGPGGTLATLSQEYDVYLLCVTDGDGKQASRQQEIELGKIRKKELQASATVLGIKKIYFLGFRDGSLNNNLYHELADKIKSILEKLRPEQLITFEPRGVSGHTDHIVVSNVASFLFHKLDFIEKLWYYCISDKNRALMKDYFIFFPPGYCHSEVDLVVDIKNVWEQKVQAIYCHKSQQHDIDWVLHIQQNLPREEYFLIKRKE